MVGLNGRAERVVVGRVKGGKRASRVSRGGKAGWDSLRVWSRVGVAGTSVLSAALNGMAFSGAAPVPAAGWALGVAVPGLTYVFARVSGMLWEAGRRRLALCGAGACLAVVGLSVSHLASSIGKLTGEGGAGPLLMAVAVDVGLVVCELAGLGAKRRK